MKNFLLFLSFIMLIDAPLLAQKPVQDLPELQEWFSISLSGEGSGISYLPGFSSNGGMNAIAIRADGDPTWYMRYAYDTVNQFSWSYGGTYMIAQADLNGDRINDYVDSRGFVYKGVIKNQPPEKVPVAQPLEHLNMRVTVTGDFNGDGYEDIITSAKSSISDSGKDILLLLLGNKDITKLKVLSIVDQPYNKDYIIGAYLTAEKQARLVTYRLSDQKSFEGFVLQSMDFTGGVTGGDVKVNVTALDSVGRYRTNGEKHMYDGTYSNLYQNKQKRVIVLGACPNTASSTQFYAINNDKFTYGRSIYIGMFQPLRGSIDNDTIEDWMSVSPQIDGKNYHLVHSGSPLEGDTLPKAQFLYKQCDGGNQKAYAIGDVTGDGIEDLAVNGGGGGGGGCFAIYKGLDWKTISVNEENNALRFMVHSSEPNPIGVSRTAILPITIEQTGTYTLTLYDGTGKLIGEIFKGELPIGEQRLPLNLKSYNLAGGFYTLRLSDGKHTRERGILITNQP